MRVRPLEVGFSVYLVCSLVSMATMSLGAAFLFLMMLWEFGGLGGAWREIRASFSFGPVRVLGILSALLVAACLGSLAWAKFWPVSYGGTALTYDFWLYAPKLWYFVWPFLLFPVIHALGELERKRALRAWFIAFLVLGAVGIFQYFSGWPRPQRIPGTQRFHAILWLGHHLSVASILIFPFFAALDWIRQDPGRSPLPRSILWSAVILGGTTLFLTASRTLWVALPVAILIWVLWNLPRRWSALIAGVLIVAAAAASQHPAIQARYADGYGLSTRQELWKANLQFFGDRPVLGVGWRLNQGLSGIYFNAIRPGQEYFQGHAHNNFLDLLAGTGALGTLAWLAWCGFVFGLTVAAARHNQGFAKGIACAWIAFHINGLTQLNFFEGKVTHSVMLMAAWALVWAVEKGKNRMKVPR